MRSNVNSVKIKKAKFKSRVRENYKNFLPIWSILAFVQLFDKGVHIGHSVANTTPYAAWMILGIRQGLSLINLFKFVYMFRAGLFIVQGVVKRRSPLWFINLEASNKSILQTAAFECGEFFITDGWVNGMLSNFKKIKYAARRAMSYKKIEFKRIHSKFQKNYARWGFTRNTWPRAVFVSNVSKSYNACHEAMCLKIPTLGIVDTNSPQKYVNLAIPGNDESFTTIIYYNNLISQFILYNKFSMVYTWYINRSNKITKNFKKWISSKFIKISQNKIRPNISYYRNFSLEGFYGFNLMFYKDVFKEQSLYKIIPLDVKHKTIRNNQLKLTKLNLKYYFKKHSRYLNSLNRLLRSSFSFINIIKSKKWKWSKKKKKLAQDKVAHFLLKKKVSHARVNVPKYNFALLNYLKWKDITTKLFNARRIHYKVFEKWLLWSKSITLKRRLAAFYKMYAILHIVSTLKYNVFYANKYIWAISRKTKRRILRNRYYAEQRRLTHMRKWNKKHWYMRHYIQNPYAKKIKRKSIIFRKVKNKYTKLFKNLSIWLNSNLGSKFVNNLNIFGLNNKIISFGSETMTGININFNRPKLRNKKARFTKKVNRRFNKFIYGKFINKQLLAATIPEFYNASLDLNMFKIRVLNKKLQNKKTQSKLLNIYKI